MLAVTEDKSKPELNREYESISKLGTPQVHSIRSNTNERSPEVLCGILEYIANRESLYRNFNFFNLSTLEWFRVTLFYNSLNPENSEKIIKSFDNLKYIYEIRGAEELKDNLKKYTGPDCNKIYKIVVDTTITKIKMASNDEILQMINTIKYSSFLEIDIVCESKIGNKSRDTNLCNVYGKVVSHQRRFEKIPSKIRIKETISGKLLNIQYYKEYLEYFKFIQVGDLVAFRSCRPHIFESNCGSTTFYCNVSYATHVFTIPHDSEVYKNYV